MTTSEDIVSTNQIPTTIDPRTKPGLISLSVSDLDRSVAFYTDDIGLSLLKSGDTTTVLGSPGAPLLILVERPGAAAWRRGVVALPGCIILLFCSRTGAILGSGSDAGWTGAIPCQVKAITSVSEALYLEDPDGHGIEVYADLLATSGRGRRAVFAWPPCLSRRRTLSPQNEVAGTNWNRLPEGTSLGHVHLQIGDVDEARAYYCETLGSRRRSDASSAVCVCRWLPSPHRNEHVAQPR